MKQYSPTVDMKSRWSTLEPTLSTFCNSLSDSDHCSLVKSSQSMGGSLGAWSISSSMSSRTGSPISLTLSSSAEPGLDMSILQSWGDGGNSSSASLNSPFWTLEQPSLNFSEHNKSFWISWGTWFNSACLTRSSSSRCDLSRNAISSNNCWRTASSLCGPSFSSYFKCKKHQVINQNELEWNYF